MRFRLTLTTVLHTDNAKFPKASLERTEWTEKRIRIEHSQELFTRPSRCLGRVSDCSRLITTHPTYCSIPKRKSGLERRRRRGPSADIRLAIVFLSLSDRIAVSYIYVHERNRVGFFCFPALEH